MRRQRMFLIRRKKVILGLEQLIMQLDQLIVLQLEISTQVLSVVMELNSLKIFIMTLMVIVLFGEWLSVRLIRIMLGLVLQLHQMILLKIFVQQKEVELVVVYQKREKFPEDALLVRLSLIIRCLLVTTDLLVELCQIEQSMK